jgi:hypothetical protein
VRVRGGQNDSNNTKSSFEEAASEEARTMKQVLVKASRVVNNFAGRPALQSSSVSKKKLSCEQYCWGMKELLMFGGCQASFKSLDSLEPIFLEIKLKNALFSLVISLY